MTQTCFYNKVVRIFAGISLAVVFYLATGLSARAVNLVEEFYLPVPEWQVLQACKAITPAIVDTNFTSITSILVTGNGTQVFYDQWEDGYEPNLANPTNTSTLIWGDGINSNGICPGFTNDPAGLPAGTVIILTNTVVSSPRNASQIFYDGRDRIAANKALVVSRAGWPSPTGPVFGGSAVVQPTIDWGTNFVSPIGQDMAEGLFRYVGFFIMASQNGTQVIIDPDGAGPLLAVTNTLNQGESYFYSGGVRRGGAVNASKPVEVNLVCGDTVNTYAIDWFTLYPQTAWSDTYYNPVSSVTVGGTLYPTFVYFYNNSANPLTVFYTNLLGAGNFSVSVNSGFKYEMPTNSGAVFTSAGNVPFTVLATVASSPSNNPAASQATAYNWGFTPLPKASLTSEAVVGWAPGTSDSANTNNGSPVWVTPTANTRVYVDYNGDYSGALTNPAGGRYDTNFDLVALQSKRIYVPATNTQTGLRVYTLDGTLLSVAWGEDPTVAGSGNPYLDLGNPVLPFPVPRLTKTATVLSDIAPPGLSVGDTLLYSVQVDNLGLLPLGNTVVLDAPPATLSYTTNSALLNGVPIPDSTNGTAFPLDAPGYTIPIILSGGTSTFQYRVTVVGAGSIVNAASIGGSAVSVTNTVAAVAPAPSLFVSKTIISPSSGVAGVGQVMQFNLQVLNNGNVTLTNVALTDFYPSNKFSYSSASVVPNSVMVGQITWTNLGNFAIGQTTNLTVSLLVTNSSIGSTNIATATSPGNTTNTGSVVFTLNTTPTPAVTVNKTLLSPASGKVGLGQMVQFNLQVYNSGYTTLTNLSLTDNFPPTNFSFVSASVTPNLITNNLVWTNLGNFLSGQITNITVTFMVTNYSATVTNFAVAASVGSATNTGSVVIGLTRSGLIVTKTVLSPTNQPVNLGSNIVFRIIIRNSGLTTITNIPLEDSYGAAYFQYVSATIPPNSVSPGSLNWTNLVAAAPLLANASLTNDVTLLVMGGATPAYNMAAVNFAIDTNGVAVAPAVGQVGVNTTAGSISGNIYSDPDQSGTLTSGDGALPDVKLSLYTDPNGDGNPADGSLLQTIVSDANGYYELLNLNTGAYVVVESLLPGYAATAPINSRLPVVIASLTASTNNNFFQYQVPASSYATINGTVWNDVSGIGSYQAGDFGLTNVQVDLIQDVNSNALVDAGETVVQTTFTATNGAYFFSGVVPGRYVVRETDFPGYVSTGDTKGTNDNQIGFLLTSGAVTNGNDFFDFYVGTPTTNSPPVAVPDFTSTLQNFPLTISPTLNDISPGGYLLAITNVAATNGTASIVNGTNVFFTPTLNFTGTATIGYTITNGNSGKATALITITVLPAAELIIGKTGPASVLALSNVSYTISITNLGPSSASNVVANDSLPVGATFVSASGGGVASSGLVSWTIGTLTTGQASNLTLIVTAPANGSLTNSAAVTSSTGDTNLVNNTSPTVTTTVTPVANLAIGKTAAASVFAVSNLTYTISVTNFGPSTASSVVVTDTLPTSVTFVSASGGGNTNGNFVVWSLGTLTIGQTSNLTLSITAPAGGSLTNTANVTSPAVDTNLVNNTSAPVVSTVTPLADLAASKSGPAGALFGTNFNYTITVTNSGPSTASGILVTDTLPAGLIFVSAMPPTITNLSSQVIWTNLGNLVSGGTTNLTLTVSSTLRGAITNIVSVGSPTGDPTPTNNISPPVVTTVTNFPPLANPDAYAIAENTTNTLSPLVNDVIRTPGGSLGIIGVSPTNGVASISGTNIIFTPTPNFLGTAFIGYTITDNVGGTNSGLITVTVTNIPPLANPDNFSIAENTTNTFSPLVNDTVRTPGGSLSLISVSPTNGVASIAGTNVIFTPTLNFLGTATVGYTITDGIGGTNSSVITINVTNVPPVANPDAYNVSENSTNTLSPLVNDTLRTAGGNLSIISVAPTNGTASISGANIIFTPSLNFVGTATIGYTITDNVGGTSSSLITVTVTNRPPQANPDSYSMAENTTNAFSPLVNDVVLTPGGSLSLVSVSPTNGVALISGTNVLFTPTTNFLGTATIGYVITDNVGGTNSSVITVTVTNVPPLANPDVYTVLQNSTNLFSPLTNDVVRTSGGTLALVSVSSTNGSATLSGTNVVFTPGSNFLGTVTLNYVITDGVGGTNSSTLTVTVLPVADLAVTKTAPAAVVAATNFDYVITVTNFGPGAAATLSVTDSLPASVSFVSASAGGTLNSGQVIWANLGSLAAGTATNLTLTVTAPANGSSLTNVATGGSPTSDPNPTNNTSPPVVTTVTPSANLAIAKVAPANVSAVSNLTYTISITNFGPSSASSVTVTDSLPASVTFVSATGSGSNNAGLVTWNLGTLSSNQVTNVTVTVTAPASGSLTNVASVGSPTGDPTPTNNVSPPVVTTVTPVANVALGKSGPVGVTFGTSFNYTISVTNFGPSTAASLSVTDSLPAGLIFVSSIPSTTTNASNQVIWTNLGNLAANATTNLTLTVSSLARGSVTNVASGGSPTLDPNPTNNVTPPVTTAITNIPPIANPDASSMTENTTNTLSPLVNDVVQTPGGTLTILSVSPTNGLASISGTNIIFTPNNNFLGTATIGYVITDNVGGTNSAVITITVTNIPPLANPDAVAIGANSGTNTFSPLVNDVVQTPGGNLSLISVTTTNGNVGIFGTNVLFAPTTNFLGVTTIVYVITDNIGGTNTGIITVTVTNRLPVLVADAASTPKNVAVTIPVLANDSDPDGNTLSLVSVTQTNGIAVISGTNVVFTPSTNFLGTAIFTYTATDGFGGSNTALISVTVTNRLPVAVNDARSTTENVSVTIPVTANDSDPDGDALTIISVSPTNGVANISGTNVIFTPATNFLGTATIGYVITDGFGGTNSALITILVTNIPPLANPDTYSVAQNTTNTLTPLVNDVVLTPGGTLSIMSVSPTNGTASILGTNILFTATTNFLGTATIGYVITDGIGGTNSSVITVTVTNVPPLANPDNYGVAENTTNNVLSPLVNDVLRTPGGNLSLVSVSPTNGVATISGTNVLFTPTTNFLGTATIGYVITDNLGGTNSSVITISVTNRPPVAVNDFASTPMNVLVTIPALANDSDPDGNPLTLVSVSPTNGIANISGTNVNFTPSTNFIGTATIGYGITDGNGGTNFALITVSVTNRPPVAINDFGNTPKNVGVTIPVLGNDSDPDGNPLSLVSVSPTNGTANILGTNVVFTPATNFLGTATIGYVITDGFGGTNSAVISVNVTNRLPIAVNDSASSTINTAVSVPVLVNDSDPDGDALTIISVSPTNGVANISGTNVVFTPATNFLGVATVGYTITDGFGGTNSAVITISLTNRAPVAVNDFASTPKNVAVTIPALANDSDPDGNLLTLTGVNPTNGTANIVGTNVVFTPATNFLGTATIGYFISDGNGGSTNALISVSVTNRPPLAVNDFGSTPKNVLVSIPALFNDSDPDGDTLTLVSVSPTNGTAFISGTNVNFTPSTNFIGTATIGYRISDGFGGTNVALISITVTNRLPVAVNDARSTPENVAVTIPVLSNDTDADGDVLSIVSVSPTNGVANISGTNVIFTPATNFLGAATVGYVITDGFGGTNSALITVTITNVPPVANPDSYSMAENTTNAFSPLVNDVVLTPGGSLSLVSVSPTNGVALISGTNVLFTPTTNFLGTATIGYVITDNVGGTNSSVITVTVTNVPPLANPDVYTVLQNSTNLFSPLTNDVVRTSGGTLALVSVSSTNGSATLSGTNVVFTPGSNFLGTVTLNYVITDGVGGTNSSTLTVTVLPVADLAVTKTAPAAVVAATNFDYVITVTNFGPGAAATLSVTDSLPASVSFVSASAGGTLNSGQVIWANLGSLAAGTATNLTLTVTAPANGSSLTNVATGGSPTSDPNPTNNTSPPVVTTVTPSANLAIAKVAPANVSAVSNLTYTISITNFGPSSASSVTVTDSLPASVTFVSATGSGSNNAGLVTWNFGTLSSGQISNVTVTVTAPASGSLTNTATVNSPTGDPTPTNNVTPPVITTVTPLADVRISKSGPAGIIFGTNYNYTISVTNFGPSTATSLSVTDSLPAGLVFISSVPATTTNASNQVVWSNLGNLISGDSTNLTLTVISTARGSLTNTATVGSPTVDPVPTNNLTPPVVTAVTNYPPLANPDNYSMTENTTNTLSPLVNDVVRTPGGSLTIVSVSSTNGVAGISGTNVSFTPTANFLGTAFVGYLITDNVGGTNSSVITILVTNIPPLANPDNYSRAQNTTNTFSPLVNDSVQTLGGNLSLVSLTPTNGTASISGTNVSFVPTLNFLGTATIGYVITDGIGGTNSSVITVTFTNVPPLANPDTYSVAENTTNNVLSPLVNDTLLTPGGNLSLVSLTPTNGTATISGTNVLFTPATNFLGTATIGYVITDNLGGTNSSVITISVTNRPPLAVNDAVFTGINLPVTIPVLANDSDPDGNPLTIVSVSPTNGTANISGTNVVFTPATNFVGNGFVRYVITDGNGGSNSALVTITVTNIIVIPTAIAQSVTTTENTAKALTLTGSDPLSQPLTFLLVSSPTNGTLSLFNTNTGAITYTPATNYFGTDTFTFRVNNGQTNSAVAAVNITVLPVADLAVTKLGATNGLAGSNLVYTITITNRGPAAATNVVVTDQLPTGFTFVSATSGGTLSNNFVNWNLATLAVGKGTNFTLTAYSLEGGTFTNVAFATSPTTDLNPTNNNGSQTNAQRITTVSALADLAVFKDGGTNVYAGATIVYTITATNLGPSTASNVVVSDILPGGATFTSASSGYTLVSNVVSWSLLSLPRGVATNFTVTLTATALSNAFVNVAFGTSTTPDPTLTNNNGSALKSKVSTKVTPQADVRVLMFGPTNVIVGDSFTYTLVVSNAGPSTASNVVLVDSLPLALQFNSASSGGIFSNAFYNVTWPKVPKLAVGEATNYTLTVTAPAAGLFTNMSYATSTTPDIDLTNNNGTLPDSQVQTRALAGQFNWLQGVPIFNPQTGLYEETVIVTNLGSGTVAAIRLNVNILTPGISLANAAGTNNGVPFVRYNLPLDPSNTVTFVLEFYDPLRVPFTNTLSVTALSQPVISPAGTNGYIAVNKTFMDTRLPGDDRFIIEFTTTPGKIYTIIYSDDLVTWKVATPSVHANANVTQWYDDGPPKTDSKSAARYYRVFQN